VTRQIRLIVAVSIVFTVILAASTARQNAGRPWPPITAETRPWTRWWWQGSAVDSADLKANLDAYRRVGLGGVELTPIYGVRGGEKEFIPYLSPRWVGMLEYTLTEAKELGLGVDMNNGTGWPLRSGSHLSQYTTGTGAPQKRWRDTPQSRMR